jgi:hypothetical protein
MPELWERLIAEHIPDPTGRRCRACTTAGPIHRERRGRAATGTSRRAPAPAGHAPAPPTPAGHPDDTSEVLQLWESLRGSREQAEWATFLNLLRDHGILLHVTSHHRLYDLNKPARPLDEDGVDSAYESAKTSMRIKRHMAANAARADARRRSPASCSSGWRGGTRCAAWNGTSPHAGS